MWNETLAIIEDSASDTDLMGYYNKDILTAVCNNNGIYGRNQGLLSAVERMADASQICLSTGFNMWCQSTLSWYTSRVEKENFKTLHDAISSGKILGGTGLSNPFKTFSGLADIKLYGHRVDGGYIVSGTLPWVSNIEYGHTLAIVFENENKDYVMALVECDEESTVVTQPNAFIALDGTATVAVTFKDAFVSDGLILTEKFSEFAPNIRSGFVLLQCGMGLGILKRAQDILTQEQKNIENHTLAVQSYDVQVWVDSLTERIRYYSNVAEQSTEDDSAFWQDILKLRRDVSEYTLQAIQASMLHSGAKGYLKNSLAERTLREGYFVATITPSLRQLNLMIEQ